MNLSGIHISAGFYDYNSIENRAVTVGSELPAELMQSVTDQGAIDYANSYQPDAVYELKGVDSDIARLDVKRHFGYAQGSGTRAVSVFCRNES